jgi:hypothetical protein
MQQLLERCERFGVENDDVRRLRHWMSQSSQLSLKVHFDSKIRCVMVPLAAEWENVHKALVDTCGPSSSAASGLGASLRIRYQDGDGDYIHLLDQNDWVALLRQLEIHFRGMRSAKVDLYCDYPLLPSVMSPQFTRQTPVSPAEKKKGQRLFPKDATPQPTARALNLRHSQLGGKGNPPELVVSGGKPTSGRPGSSPQLTARAIRDMLRGEPGSHTDGDRPSSPVRPVAKNSSSWHRWEADTQVSELHTILSQPTSAAAESAPTVRVCEENAYAGLGHAWLRDMVDVDDIHTIESIETVRPSADVKGLRLSPPPAETRHAPPVAFSRESAVANQMAMRDRRQRLRQLCEGPDKEHDSSPLVVAGTQART